MNGLIDRLAQHPFFKDFDHVFLEQIAPCGFAKKYEKDTYIFKEGEEANQFIVIYEGHITLELHMPGKDPVLIQTVGKGNVVGWSWLFPPYRWHFHCRVIEPATTITFDGKCLLAKCDAHRELGYELMKRFSQMLYHRLQATRGQLLSLCDIA
jgi:CRP/FNR family transcriptional regulator, cyclic AMP receptor protein